MFSFHPSSFQTSLRTFFLAFTSYSLFSIFFGFSFYLFVGSIFFFKIKLFVWRMKVKWNSIFGVSLMNSHCMKLWNWIKSNSHIWTTPKANKLWIISIVQIFYCVSVWVLTSSRLECYYLWNMSIWHGQTQIDTFI